MIKGSDKKAVYAYAIKASREDKISQLILSTVNGFYYCPMTLRGFADFLEKIDVKLVDEILVQEKT